MSEIPQIDYRCISNLAQIGGLWTSDVNQIHLRCRSDLPLLSLNALDNCIFIYIYIFMSDAFGVFGLWEECLKVQRAGKWVVVSQNALPTLLTTLGYMFARGTFCMRLMCHFTTEISTLGHACILCMCCACVVHALCILCPQEIGRQRLLHHGPWHTFSPVPGGWHTSYPAGASRSEWILFWHHNDICSLFIIFFTQDMWRRVDTTKSMGHARVARHSTTIAQMQGL